MKQRIKEIDGMDLFLLKFMNLQLRWDKNKDIYKCDFICLITDTNAYSDK